MILNKKIFFGMFLLIFFMLSCSLVSATYMSSNVQAFQYSSAETGTFNQAMCQNGQDFLIQITPFGCSPGVVRTDLLEENNVPVFCQLGATKINPLIDVEAIDSISFSGTYPKEVAGIGFHPAKSALGVSGDLNTPVLGNIGYVVITLKKQENASAIPEYISGNLTAKIRYNVKNAFGIGNALLYIPEFSSDKEWEENKYLYSFWSGRGYVKADGITTNEAQISVYADDDKLSTVTLKKGESSSDIYMPGFECQAGLKVRLDSIDNPDTRAQLRINAEVIEVAKDEKFLENKCQITNLAPNGLIQKASIRCQEDNKVSNFDLTISPKVILSIDKNKRDVGIGEFLYKDNEGKSVYLAYIGAKGEATTENLFVYLVSIPNKNEDKLTEEELSSLNSIIVNLAGSGHDASGIINKAEEWMRAFAGLSATIEKAVVSGEWFYRINSVDGDEDAFGKKVAVVDFAGAQDKEIPSEVQETYNNAKEDYERLRESFSSEAYQTTGTYGEEALYKEIILAWDAEQKKTASDLCKEFSESYPNSKKIIPECRSASKLSSNEVNEFYVTINGETKRISLDAISEPTFMDYGVKVLVMTPGQGTLSFEPRKGQYMSESGVSVQLISALDTSAKLQVSFTTDKGTTKTELIELTKGITYTVKEGYSFTLADIHLNKIAKVSVLSNINNAGTQTDFSFKIGIEKRAFELSPDQVKKIIEKLDKSMATWKGISATLGNVTQTMKTACLATSAALIVKNFLLNMEGAGIARQKVMRAKGGWYDQCTKIKADTGVSMDKCLADNADTIDKEVEELSKEIEKQNEDIKKIEEDFVTQNFLSENQVDTEKFANEYKTQVINCLNGLSQTTFENPNKAGETIKKTDIISALSLDYGKGAYTVEELRDIELYCKTQGNPDLKSFSNSNLYSVLYDVNTNSNNLVKKSAIGTSFGVDGSQVNSLQTDKETIKLDYLGLKNTKRLGDFDSESPIAVVQTLPDGNSYSAVLDDSGTSRLSIKFVTVSDATGKTAVTQRAIYDSNGALVKDPNVLKNFEKVYFQEYDTSSYAHKYLNAELKYYETEPYKGLPAIVPFDTTNGWYAAIKQTLPLGSNIASYEASGRVSSFYVCNVGEDGREENIGGDDICEMINTATGQAYNQFPGLSEADAKKTIDCAVNAIQQASRAYRSGVSNVQINTKCANMNVKVGTPATGVPDFQCQDFMSPDDCMLMFNLCDPVICPSSRCNLGGAYPVKDVVQSGVIGSLVLCLPNAQEGIAVPICLTGVKAGIDGFLSVEQSYRDCLQESLDSGKMMGICDEIHSIYLCDFFWKQALPFADLIIPKIIANLLGQNVRGGGEYLGVSDAWNGASKAVDYFVNYYGVNSKNAFMARSTEAFVDNVCKLYASATVPSGADLLNQLTSPDSPMQFHGRFDETTMTTATVPPQSHYKVFYHIYAGQDSGAYYQVYLKGASGSSYYHDTSSNYMVASGYVAVGDYASETKDFIATAGYKQMCINVNGQEECGFEEVSTSFAVDYVTDKYAQEQAETTDIKTESECVSGTASAYSLLNLNAQSAAEELINPAIYENGIIRICATANPGLGTDENAGGNNSRWKQVGICGSNNVKCWLDTQSVKDVIKIKTIEGKTLDKVSEDYLTILQNEGGYLSNEAYGSAITEINKQKEPSERIVLINKVIEKAFWTWQKAELFYKRGDAYTEILVKLIEEFKITGKKSKTDILKITVASKRVLESAKALEGTIVPGNKPTINGKTLAKINTNCFTSTYYGVYLDYAKVDTNCVYSDSVGDKYTITGTDGNSKTITMGAGNPYKNLEITWKIPNSCKTISKANKLSGLKPGDLIFYVWDEKYDHSAIFIGWKDETNHIATLFDWNYYNTQTGQYGISLGQIDGNGKACSKTDIYSNSGKSTTNFCAVYRYYTADLSDNKHPVYVYQHPRIIEGATEELSVPEETPITSTDPLPVTDNSGQTELPSQPAGSAATPPADTSSAATGNTIGEKVLKAASDITLGGSTDNGVMFVSTALYVGGVKGNDIEEIITFAAPSVDSLVSVLSKRADFSRVDVSANLEQGDVVLIGKGCDVSYSAGIASSISEDKKKISVYTNLDEEVTAESLSFPLLENGFYIYEAYRYIGDTKESITPREKWDLIGAIEEVNTRTGNYGANKPFSDQLVFDGVLTEQECKDLRGTSSFAGNLGGAVLQKSMLWLKNNVLRPKCVQDTSCKKYFASNAI